jgi:peroxiredoxin
MKKIVPIIAVVGAAGAVAVAAYLMPPKQGAIAAPTTSNVAPAFTLPSSIGKDISLADFKGKYVVLEWWNHQCPFVVKHYGGNMQSLQKQMKEKGVVWLTICSSAPGKQGHVVADQANDVMKSKGGEPAYILLDPDGKVGKLYNAKTTPQMVLITPAGDVVYNGAIDSIPSSNVADIATAENYLLKAYGEHSSGMAVSTPTSKPYGCSVKY